MKTIDRISTALGHCAAWLYFLTGVMIGYEVLARYFFNAPTIWAAEISQLFLIWGTFLAMAYALKNRQHIRIEIIITKFGNKTQKVFEAVSLVFISVLCTIVVWYGWGIAWDSFERGRSTGTMLNIPNWWTEAVIPAGFTLLLLQSLVELWRVMRGHTQAP